MAAKFVLGVADVGPVRTWVGRFMEHIAYAAAWFAATVARVDPAIVAVDLAMGSISLVVARIALATTMVALVVAKVVLVVVEVVLAIARVLEQCPENFQTESIHIHPGKWTS